MVDYKRKFRNSTSNKSNWYGHPPPAIKKGLMPGVFSFTVQQATVNMRMLPHIPRQCCSMKVTLPQWLTRLAWYCGFRKLYNKSWKLRHAVTMCILAGKTKCKASTSTAATLRSHTPRHYCHLPCQSYRTINGLIWLAINEFPYTSLASTSCVHNQKCLTKNIWNTIPYFVRTVCMRMCVCIYVRTSKGKDKR
jgi:hypothetical protein